MKIWIKNSLVILGFTLILALAFLLLALTIMYWNYIWPIVVTLLGLVLISKGMRSYITVDWWEEIRK